MNLKEYIDTTDRGGAKRLAERLGISKSYLSQMASGQAFINPERCVIIEIATNGVVCRRDLRPHDWMKIWPELIEISQKQTQFG